MWYKGSMGEREERIGKAIERKYWELDSIKRRSNWGRKLVASSYMHHRDSYEGTEVEERRTYDSNPRVYMLKYESGLCGYLTPQDDEWAVLVPKAGIGRGVVRDSLAVEKAEREALEAITGMVFEGMVDSNFYQALYTASLDRDILGIGYMHVIDGYDSGDRGLVFKCVDPQECVVADDYLGRTEAYIRRFRASSEDLVRRYGRTGKLEGLSERVAKSGSASEPVVECYEAIVPSGYLYDQEQGVAIDGKKAFVHFLWVPSERAMLEESGFDEMPVAVTRRNYDSEKMPYGVSLAEDCLEEVVKLNDLANQRQAIVQQVARPAMWIPNTLRGRYNGKPGGENYAPSGTDKPTPIYTNLDISSILSDIQDLRQTLRGLIPVDLFETIMGSTDSRKTATEVSMKKNEAMILLAFQIGTIKRDCLEPVFKRCARIMVKHMGLGQENAEAQRRYLYDLIDRSRLELNSVFIRRLNAYLANVGDDDVVGSLMNIYQIYPQAIDTVKLDEFVSKWLLGKGLLSSLMASKEEIQKSREARAEIQRQQLQAQTNEQNSKAMLNESKARAEAAGGQAEA